MVLRNKHVINIDKVKPLSADIVQQCRCITFSEGISGTLAPAEESAAMKVDKSRPCSFPVFIRVGNIQKTVWIVFRILNFGNDVLPIIL